MGLLSINQVAEVELAEIQELHVNEFAIMNEIDILATKVAEEKTGWEELEQKLDAYVTHVREHFAYEEELMEEYDFVSYDLHKLAHDMFIADLNYAEMAWKRRGEIEKMIHFVRKAPEWTIMHINSVDAPTATYLAEKMR